MSASDVVRIALANTGFVLLCTIASKMLPPGFDDLVEVFKNYLAHLAPQAGVQLYSKSSLMSKRSGSIQYLHSASPFTACTCIGSLPSFE